MKARPNYNENEFFYLLNFHRLIVGKSMELTIGTGSKYGPINIRSKSKPIPVIKDATCER